MGDTPGGWLDDAYGDASSRRRMDRELRKFASEFLVFVTAKGELAGATEFNTLGYDSDDQAGHHIAELIHPEDLPMVFDVIERARLTEGFEESVEARARHKDGSWRLFDARVYDASLRSNLQGAVLRIRDITEEHNARVVARTDAEDNRFLSLAEMLPLGILLADARGWVAYCNRGALQILDRSTELLVGHGWQRAVVKEDRPEVVAATERAIESGQDQQVTFRVVTGRAQRWAHAKIVPVTTENLVTGWIASIEDVTERHQAESALAHRATHDALTGLPNRTLLEDRLAQARGRLQRGSTSITVLFVDLDGFKEINDTLGHRVGDGVLTEIGTRLATIMRSVDTVARFGGDEFVALCESLSADERDLVLRRIQDALAVPMMIDGQIVRVGASVGTATTNDPSMEMVDLLALADQSMYREKQARKEAG